MGKELSKHDSKVLAQIRAIDDEWGWMRWSDISDLASQLENDDERAMWSDICKHYSHLAETGRR